MNQKFISQSRRQVGEMENLPPEILERIFANLTTVKDLENCAQTCQNWQQVISSMYKHEKSKIFCKIHFIQNLTPVYICS